jgi:hypothetical protein
MNRITRAKGNEIDGERLNAQKNERKKHIRSENLEKQCKEMRKIRKKNEAG